MDGEQLIHPAEAQFETGIDPALAAEAAALDEAAAPAAPVPEPEPAPSAETVAETKQLFVMVLGPLFDKIAPAWEVMPKEVDALADVYTVVLLKYFPDGVHSLGPELAALGVTFAILGPRWKKPRVIEATPVPSAPAAPPHDKPD